MLEFMLIRIFRSVITLWVVFTAVFFGSRLSGDAMDFLFPMGLDSSIHYEMQVYFGLDGSYFEQYWKFWRGFFEGNMGISLSDRRPVTEIYGERIGNTMRLFISALLFSICIGVPLGIIAAVKRGTVLSTVIMSVAFLGYGVPNFILAIFMILVFSFSLHWFPSSGNTTWMHFVMPVFALGFSMMASEVRFTRSAMLEILGADYIRTAYAKGLKEIIVIGKHALRNASIPIVSVIGLQVAGFVGAVVLVEVVFSLRGIGELTVNAAIARDYPLLQFGIVLWAVVVTGVSLIVDLIYGLIDPRIRTVK
jgi:ABC-type dipeptide/oligopeptide/nickel transport system permease component